MLGMIYLAGFIITFLLMVSMSDWEPSGETGNQSDDIASFIFVLGALVWPVSLPVALCLLARRKSRHPATSAQ